MPVVDPDDDSLYRYVVFRYAYDPERRERRNRTIVAFDNEAEFTSFIKEAAAELRRQQVEGLADPRDHYCGAAKEPGYRDRQQQRRLRNRLLQSRLRRRTP